ncbi:hypothetical protein [Brevibacillus laterosporus]|uniref:hypothetical protein n=1 Tax=Brevibacillus laterosporus TaxID=1465 RepID=UPI00215C1E1E|nr:hypothetical protein [Brevibacillus laterosporus]MCR8994565.1 hypothetical protein [Brevibacillus laterosporus]
MSRKYGYKTKDDTGVLLVLKSNHGKDKENYLDNAIGMKRPILVEIQSEIFSSYKFTNFALTISEAKELAKELVKMAEFLEENSNETGE